LGGGLNSVLSVPLPGGGLAPGESVAVALTFAAGTGGRFWVTDAEQAVLADENAA
jgi:hypothetical protein